MKQTLLILLLTGIVAEVASAQQLPPGKWWRRPEVVNTLSLTEDQQTRLDTVFRNSANELIDLKAEVEKQNVALRGELEQTQLNRQNLLRVAGRLTEARGKLFERELMMLADMRAVLTDAQWTRLRAELEARRPMQNPMQNPMRQQRPRPQQRP